jgi:parallel beta-helix repeat protein
LYYFFFITISCFSYASIARITGNQIINKPIIYKDTTINLTEGKWIVNPGGKLTLENCVIYAKITPENPFLIKADYSDLHFYKTIFHITTDKIIPNPLVQSTYNVIVMNHSSLLMEKNFFEINNPYTVELLIAKNNNKKDLFINNNVFKNFHGGIYLYEEKNSKITNNVFDRISFSSVFLSGLSANINNNFFLFSGNLYTGDAIDIVNSNDVYASNNFISSSAGYGIFIKNVKNIVIDKNKISDGASYGIYIDQSELINENIKITNNYIAQNKYGLAGKMINGLYVLNNIFIQSFDNATNRQFWTDNQNLLITVNKLTWINNYYKEAFTQDIAGDNTQALQFVTFPKQGGVIF